MKYLDCLKPYSTNSICTSYVYNYNGASLDCGSSFIITLHMQTFSLFETNTPSTSLFITKASFSPLWSINGLYRIPDFHVFMSTICRNLWFYSFTHILSIFISLPHASPNLLHNSRQTTLICTLVYLWYSCYTPETETNITSLEFWASQHHPPCYHIHEVRHIQRTLPIFVEYHFHHLYKLMNFNLQTHHSKTTWLSNPLSHPYI